MISYQDTPIQELQSPLLMEAGVRILVKREDLNHPQVSGNKWWKLKYNLEAARAAGENTLLTFGGAYSNHLYAVAAAASLLGMRSIGIVRGEETLPINPTLRFVKSHGMELHFISRTTYREKDQEEFLETLRQKFGSFYLLPEGGTNALAVKGCREFGARLAKEATFDYLCLPVGTGGTLAGMIESLELHQEAIGFAVLKNGGFLTGEVQRLLTGSTARWSIETDYHFGGYAKVTPQLMEFIRAQESENLLPLDPVYTGKALFGVFDLIRRGAIRSKSVVMMVHTGGLQGAKSAE